jgi:hypothetical protein
MKHKLIFTFVLAAIFLTADAQTSKRKELHLYATFGAKCLQPKSFFYGKDVSPGSVATMGAGSFIQKSRFQFITEFFYSSGSRQEQNLLSQYSGIDANLLIGYSFELSSKLSLSLRTGFGYSLSHMFVTNEQHQDPQNMNASIFHDNEYTLPVAVMLQRACGAGTFIGVQIGYNVRISGDDSWRFEQNGTTTRFTSAPDGAYVQFIIGGLLDLNRKQS